MPKIEKDLLKVKGLDGQWHYVPAVGGSVDTAPTWDALQDKPFSTLGSGLEVDENGVLSAEGGSSGSANAVQYVAQTLTDEQKAQARTNIEASPIPSVSTWKSDSYDDVFDLYDMGVGYGIVSGYNSGQTPDGMTLPALVIFGYMSYGQVTTTVYDSAGVVWRGTLYLSSGTYSDFTKQADYVTNTALTDILQGYMPADELEDILLPIEQAIITKLDKNQGTGNAGKILGIGADGIVVPQDNPTYTLPQATADALGGIKADAATAEDTQVVRIGTDGKLRTKPTGGSTVTVDDALSSTSENPVQNKIITAALAGKITAPTTAAVGQIIKVKTIDGTGKPTEWEAADLPSGGGGGTYRLVIDTTLSEAVETITISQDKDGNAFELTDCLVWIFAAVTEASQLVVIPNGYWTNGTYFTFANKTATDYSYDYIAYCHGSDDSFYGYAIRDKANSPGTNTSYNSKRASNPRKSKITSIKLNCKFAANARILIYGR